MSRKLPVVTIKFKRNKKIGLEIGLIVSLMLFLLMCRLIPGLDFGGGKFLATVFCVINLCIFLFTILALIQIRKDGSIAMYISNRGINDLSTGHHYGMVQWQDVTKVKVVDEIEHPGRRYIILKVKNPQDYIDREPLQIKKRSLILKFHYYGTPICFSNRALDCTFEELEETVRAYYANYVAYVDEQLEAGRII